MSSFPKLSERLRAVYKSKLKTGDKLLLAYLSWRVDSQTGETWVGLGRMARECGFGHSTLVGRLKALTRKGWIERVRRGRSAEDGHNLTSITRLLPEKFGSLKSGIPESGIPAAGIPENRDGSPKSGIPETGRNPGIKEIRSLSEKKKAQAVPSPLAFSGQYLKVSEAQARMLADAFPWVQLEAECRKMDAWLNANPGRRPRNQSRFAHNWVSRITPPKGGPNRAEQRRENNREAIAAGIAE